MSGIILDGPVATKIINHGAHRRVGIAIVDGLEVSDADIEHLDVNLLDRAKEIYRQRKKDFEIANAPEQANPEVAQLAKRIAEAKSEADRLQQLLIDAASNYEKLRQRQRDVQSAHSTARSEAANRLWQTHDRSIGRRAAELEGQIGGRGHTLKLYVKNNPAMPLGDARAAVRNAEGQLKRAMATDTASEDYQSDLVDAKVRLKTAQNNLDIAEKVHNEIAAMKAEITNLELEKADAIASRNLPENFDLGGSGVLDLGAMFPGRS